MRQLFILLIIACFAGCDQGTPQSSKSDSSEIANGTKPIKELVFADMDGRLHKIEDYRGKRVFLNFWATWCKPCRTEMPSIEKAKVAAGDDVVFMLITHERKHMVDKYVERYQYNLDYAISGGNLVEFGIQILPTTMIFDESGKLEVEHVGALDWSAEENLNLILGK